MATLTPGQMPFDVIIGLNGHPLNGGRVYIGEPNKDPEAYPLPVFWDADGTIPAAQPLETSGGYVVRAGTPARWWTTGAYSITVRDRQGRQVWHAARVAFEIANGSVTTAALADGAVVAEKLPSDSAAQAAIARRIGAKQRCANIAALKAAPKPEAGAAATVETEGYLSPGDGGGNTFFWSASSNEADNGGTVIAPTAGGAGRWIAVNRKVVTSWQFGMLPSNKAEHQARMDAMNYSDAQVIHLMPGVIQAYLNNPKSNRTFICHEDSIIDGTVHLMVGSGPEFGNPLSVVRNVTVIGCLSSTVRIGTYYADGLHASGATFRITEVSPSYVNQSKEGGSMGIHFYFWSRNFQIGHVQIDSTVGRPTAPYGLGIDTGPVMTTDPPHFPQNIYIRTMSIDRCAVGGLVLSYARNIRIGTLLINRWEQYAGINLNVAELQVDKLFVLGYYAKQGGNNTWENVRCIGSTLQIGELISRDAPGIGLFANGSRVEIDKLTAYDSGRENVRVSGSTGWIGDMELGAATSVAGDTNSGHGYCGISSTMQIGTIRQYGNASPSKGMVLLSTDNGSIIDIVRQSEVATDAYVAINLVGCNRTRINNYYVKGVSGAAGVGLRLESVYDAYLGNGIIENCTIDVAHVNVQRLSYNTIQSRSNATTRADELRTTAGFLGCLQPPATGA